MFFSNKKYSRVSQKDLFEIMDQLKLPWVYVFTPTNLKKEREKFFDSSSYEPQFKYKIVKNQNDKILQQLSTIEEVTDVDPRISKFYLKLIATKSKVNEIMHAVGDNQRISELSMKLYGFPSRAYFNNVCRILRAGGKGFYNTITIDSSVKSYIYDVDEISDVFQRVFQLIGLNDWGVEVSAKSFGDTFKVALKEKKVYLGARVRKNPISLRKIIVHEIFTHVIRHINGLASGVPALSKSNLIPYQFVEEGLASYNEEKFGTKTDRDIVYSAVKAYALYLAPKLSFRQLYDVVHGFVPKNTAFKTVFRVKRGLSDTSIPGVFMKDYIYFKGFRRVRRRIFEDPSVYKKLYAGKISFAQVRWVEEGLINMPKVFFEKEEVEKILDKVVKVG